MDTGGWKASPAGSKDDGANAARMSIFRQCAPLVALLFVVGAGEAARAQSAASDAPPVRVFECKLDRGSTQTPTGSDPTVIGPTVHLRYASSASKRAKAITFGLFDGANQVAQFEDHGKFSSGAQVEHDFAIPNSVFPIAQPHCTAIRVVYDDGSSWTASR